MLTIITGRSGCGKTEYVLEEINKGVKAGLGGQILLVPEQYSHETERALAAKCDDNLSLYAEVLSFTRLCNRVFTECGGLSEVIPDKGGKLLIMSLALKSVSGQLQVYGRQTSKPEFLEGLLKMRQELSGCMTSLDSLEQLSERTDGTIAGKLSDIALILETYDALLKQYADDARERLERLAEKISASEVGSGGLYIDAFTDFTAIELEIIEEFLKKATDVTITLSLDEENEDLFLVQILTLQSLEKICKKRGIAIRRLALIGKKRREAPELEYLEKALMDYSASVYDGTCSAIEMYGMNDIVSECELAAAKALEFLMSDSELRCSDIAVAARNFEQYETICESVFRLYGLPVFINRKDDILQKPVMTLITEAFEIINNGFAYHNVFRYLKTNLSPMSIEERDKLENYCLTWNIRGTMWTRNEPWDMNPRGYVSDKTDDDTLQLIELDRLRREFTAPLLKLRHCFSAAISASDYVRALYTFLEDIDLPQRLEERAALFSMRGDLQAADEYSQLWDILISAIEQLDTLIGTMAISREEFTALFTLLLSTYDVASIPVALDRVTLSGLESIREKRIKCLILMGASDDALPNTDSDTGLLSHDERREIRAMGLELHEDRYDINREIHLIYSVLSKPSHRLIISYPLSGGDIKKRPSFIINRIATLFNTKLIPESVLDNVFRTYAPVPAFQYAVSNEAGTIRNAAELCLSGYPLWAERLRILNAKTNEPRGNLSNKSVRALIGTSVNITATRAERFNSCHFSYFMRYGLRAKTRRRALFEAPELGTLVHYVLENVSRDLKERGGFKTAGTELCRELTAKYMSKYAEDLFGSTKKSKRFLYLFQRLEETAIRIVNDVIDELSSSDFEPLDFELTFAHGGDMPPVNAGSSNELTISGLVDRVDGYIKNDVLYLRVCDYKTGRAAFSLSDIYYGMGLQMLIYLFALGKHGESRYNTAVVPAGVLYTPARDIILPMPRSCTDSEVEKERVKQLKRSGLILADPEIIEAMENSGSTGRIPVTVKDGVIKGNVATAEQLGKLARYVEKLLSDMGEELMSGKIDADPFERAGHRTDCDYCEYAAACRFDEKRDKARMYKKLDNDEFWDYISQ